VKAVGFVVDPCKVVSFW